MDIFSIFKGLYYTGPSPVMSMSEYIANISFSILGTYFLPVVLAAYVSYFYLNVRDGRFDFKNGLLQHIIGGTIGVASASLLFYSGGWKSVIEGDSGRVVKSHLMTDVSGSLLYAGERIADITMYKLLFGDKYNISKESGDKAIDQVWGGYAGVKGNEKLDGFFFNKVMSFIISNKPVLEDIERIKEAIKEHDKAHDEIVNSLKIDLDKLNNDSETLLKAIIPLVSIEVVKIPNKILTIPYGEEKINENIIKNIQTYKVIYLKVADKKIVPEETIINVPGNSSAFNALMNNVPEYRNAITSITGGDVANIFLQISKAIIEAVGNVKSNEKNVTSESENRINTHAGKAGTDYASSMSSRLQDLGNPYITLEQFDTFRELNYRTALTPFFMLSSITKYLQGVTVNTTITSKWYFNKANIYSKTYECVLSQFKSNIKDETITPSSDSTDTITTRYINGCLDAATDYITTELEYLGKVQTMINDLKDAVKYIETENNATVKTGKGSNINLQQLFYSTPWAPRHGNDYSYHWVDMGNIFMGIKQQITPNILTTIAISNNVSKYLEHTQHQYVYLNDDLSTIKSSIDNVEQMKEKIRKAAQNASGKPSVHGVMPNVDTAAALASVKMGIGTYKAVSGLVGGGSLSDLGNAAFRAFSSIYGFFGFLKSLSLFILTAGVTALFAYIAYVVVLWLIHTILTLVYFSLPGVFWFFAVLNWFIRSGIVIILTPLSAFLYVFNGKRGQLYQHFYLLLAQSLTPLVMVMTFFILVNASLVVDITTKRIIPAFNSGGTASALTGGLSDALIKGIEEMAIESSKEMDKQYEKTVKELKETKYPKFSEYKSKNLEALNRETNKKYDAELAANEKSDADFLTKLLREHKIEAKRDLEMFGNKIMSNINVIPEFLLDTFSTLAQQIKSGVILAWKSIEALSTKAGLEIMKIIAPKIADFVEMILRFIIDVLYYIFIIAVNVHLFRFFSRADDFLSETIGASGRNNIISADAVIGRLGFVGRLGA